MIRNITCGIFLFRPDKRFLICHPTGDENIWSIPKGLKGENESYTDCAFREFYEETNINLWQLYGQYCDSRIILCDVKLYKNKIKTLWAFSAILHDDEVKKVDAIELKCNSFFELHGKQVPEIDAYKWILPSELNEKYNLHCLQREVLMDMKPVRFEK